VAEAMIREQLTEEALRIYLKGREETASTDGFAVELSSLYELSGDYGNAALELMVHYRNHPDRRDEVQGAFARFPRTESVSGQLFKQMKKKPEILSGNEWLFLLFLQAAYSSGNDDSFGHGRQSEGRDGEEKFIVSAGRAFRSAIIPRGKATPEIRKIQFSDDGDEHRTPLFFNHGLRALFITMK
jgi:hypothetical protein